MARPANKDPLDKFRWTVEIEGFTRMGFTVCGVPSLVYTTKKYAEGGAHLYPKQIIDSIEYKPVVLERGVTADMSFVKWVMQPMEMVRGKAEQVTIIEKGIVNANATLAKYNALKKSISGGLNASFNEKPLDPNLNIPLEYRRDVIIKHYNRGGEVVKTYKLYKAFPVEFAPASDFASDADDTISMEKLVLVYESFEVISTKRDANPTDIRDLTKRLIRRL